MARVFIVPNFTSLQELYNPSPKVSVTKNSIASTVAVLLTWNRKNIRPHSRITSSLDRMCDISFEEKIMHMSEEHDKSYMNLDRSSSLTSPPTFPLSNFTYRFGIRRFHVKSGTLKMHLEKLQNSHLFGRSYIDKWTLIRRTGHFTEEIQKIP